MARKIPDYAVPQPFLVTGDMDLLKLKEFHGIEILTPGAFELLLED